MLKEILDSFSKVLVQLEDFSNEQLAISSKEKEEVKILDASIRLRAADVAKADRVQKKLSKLIG